MGFFGSRKSKKAVLSFSTQNKDANENDTPRSESTAVSETPRSLLSDTTAPSQVPIQVSQITPRSITSESSSGATTTMVPASHASSKVKHIAKPSKNKAGISPRSFTSQSSSGATTTIIPASTAPSKTNKKVISPRSETSDGYAASQVPMPPSTNTSKLQNNNSKATSLKPKATASSQIRKKSAQKPSSDSDERALETSSSQVYIPPSKLLKHLDPDSKSYKKKDKKGGLSTQVNRLLKQNTQELFGSLTPEVKKAFETLFDRIDVTDSGGITAKEIQQLIKKHTNKVLTVAQVKEVLCELDVKGTGDIEFDEFIFMLSQPSNYVRLLDKRDLKGLKGKETQKYLEQKQKQDETDTTYVFFEALRNATKQDSMTALRTFYKNRLKKLNDHVIHDWSAGQRCIGLSDQEMLKRYETIQGELLRQRVNFCKDNSYKQSPYARPLEWGVMNLREAILARRRLACEAKQPKPEPRRVKMSEFVVTPKAVPLPRYVIKKRSPLKRTFNYDQLADIRTKVDNIANKYYTDLKQVAGENSTVVQKELAVDEIRSPASQANFMHTFEAYCAPFVVSPWIPMPSPTLQASFSPLGRSKLTMRTDIHHY